LAAVTSAKTNVTARASRDRRFATESLRFLRFNVTAQVVRLGSGDLEFGDQPVWLAGQRL
jgi:hypothetical protein